jgi:putative ABC transport system permease protein
MSPSQSSTALRERPAPEEIADGGVPARRAVIRWALRLSRREWRQQLLVLIMLAVAVAATIMGAAVATNTPPAAPSASTFGTGRALITLPGHAPDLAAGLAAITARYRTVDVIENQDLTTGLLQNVELRAQNPAGPYGSPMIALVSGRYPAGPGQVALTSQVATLYNLHTGSTWRVLGRSWRVTGLVKNPSNLLDEFALAAPGQVPAPSQVTILLGTGHVSSSGLPPGASVSYPQPSTSQISPATVVLVVAVLGLIFIGLVAVAGFSVMAQRRLRALGMLSALGATERNVRLVMVASGAAVGVVATIIGAVIGFAAWIVYYPHLETATAHTIDPANLPWWAIITGMLLAVLTAVLAARRPATIVSKIPVVAALSGRPAPPKGVHRSAGPAVIAIAAGLCLLALCGGWGGNSGQDSGFLLLGLIAMVTGMCLLAPLCVTALAAAAGPRAPVAVRVALRDLVRYRARSGAALAAISFAVFLSVLICIIASVRFSNVLDYTGANLTPSQLIVYTPSGAGSVIAGPDGSHGQPLTQAQLSTLHARVDGFARSLHAQYTLPLESAGGTLLQTGRQDNNFSGGPVYVATPALLRTYGIKTSQIAPDADVLSVRPGLAAEPHMLLVYGRYFSFGSKGGPPRSVCPAGECLANPEIQQIGGLPTGVDAPNTVFTPHAVHAMHATLSPSGWLIQAARPLTAAQISAARELAVGTGATIETKSGQLSLSQISDGVTLIGLLIALGVLAMSVGLIRSETAGDLRTLTATGASSRTRRTITAATAGALGLLGALLGTAAATLAGLAWARSSLGATFGGVPATDFAAVLVGLPLVAAVAGWLLAGREPPVIARRPLE